MSDDLEFIVIDDIPEYIFCIGDDEENERVIALSGKDGAFQYEKVAELPTTGEDGVLYLVPKSHTTQTASGNPISVNITDGAGKIESLKLDGDTTQQTYTGKNLAPYPYQGGGSGRGITFTSNPDESVTLNGQNDGTANSAYNLFNNQSAPLQLEAGTYYFMQPSNSAIGFVMYDGTRYYDFDSSNEYSQTFSSGINIRHIYIQVRKGNTTTFDNVKVYPMLSTLPAQTEADFEPYVGGTASPNPDYPQTVNIVTGVQTVDVVGKNLFDKANANIINAYISAGKVIASSPTNDRCIYIPCEPNTTYTVQKMLQGTTSYNRFRLGTASAIPQVGDTLSDFWNAGDGSTTTKHTITTGANAHYLVAYIYRLDTATSLNEILASFQIEKGSTATAYAPYSKQTLPIDLGSIELCKLSTYQDYIYKDGDDWKVHKAIATITVDGSEDWVYNNNANYASANNIANMATPVNAQVICYCRTHTGVLSAGSGADFITAVGDLSYATDVHTASKLVRFKDIRFTTAEELQSWLSQNNTTIYYAVATPTDTTITDQTLIAQLEAVRTAALSTGSNTISNTATGTNLAGDLEVGYYGYDPLNKYDKYFWLDVDGGYESL